MIVLDTNVLSELLHAAPGPAVLRWAASEPLETLFTTTVTQPEMLYGVKLLPAGQRRQRLEEAVMALFEKDFVGRVLPFDGGEAAIAYGRIAAERKQSGRPIPQFDAQIASIAHTRGARLASRNLAHFQGCGLHVIDPWQG
jgi:predicted nucleic acid-binding protein